MEISFFHGHSLERDIIPLKWIVVVQLALGGQFSWNNMKIGTHAP